MKNVAEKKEVQPRPHGNSPIPQLDGISEIESLTNEGREIFSFKSNCTEEDIQNCLEEIFQNTNVTSKKILLRDQLGPKNGDYLYTLELKINKGNIKKTSFSWPTLSSTQKSVFRSLKRIL